MTFCFGSDPDPIFLKIQTWMQILLSLRGNFCIDFLSFFLSSNIKKLHMQMFNKSQRGSDQDLNKAIRILRSCMKSPQF